jgi:hypothetical protein
MRKLLVIAWFSGLVLIGSSSVAQAFVVGWNFIQAASCYGFNSGGVDFLVIYPTIGGALITSDVVSIVTATQYCANGNAFYAYWNGSSWSGIVLIPGLH